MCVWRQAHFKTACLLQRTAHCTHTVCCCCCWARNTSRCVCCQAPGSRGGRQGPQEQGAPACHVCQGSRCAVVMRARVVLLSLCCCLVRMARGSPVAASHVLLAAKNALPDPVFCAVCVCVAVNFHTVAVIIHFCPAHLQPTLLHTAPRQMQRRQTTCWRTSWGTWGVQGEGHPPPLNPQQQQQQEATPLLAPASQQQQPAAAAAAGAVCAQQEQVAAAVGRAPR